MVCLHGQEGEESSANADILQRRERRVKFVDVFYERPLIIMMNKSVTEKKFANISVL